MDNKQKNEKYKDLMNKLKKAMNNEFYYEAIFIEYAIIEDRTESMLKHANIKIINKNGNKLSLNEKLKIIMQNKIFISDRYIVKHINDILIKNIHNWKNKRNDLIHNLIKTNCDDADIKLIANEGNEIIKILNNKSTLINKHLDIKNSDFC